MACATLKRSLDWDPLNSPPHSGPTSDHRPSKRRCSTHVSFLAQQQPPKQPSPFGDVHPKFTSDEIAASIKEEMLRLHHRKKLHFTGSGSNGGSLNQPLSLVLPPSPSGNTSPERCSPSLNDNLTLPSSSIGLLSPSRRDQPLFTFRQVGLICERLMKERESQVREEYDRVLTTKLAEQYDAFVKFTFDQIQKRFENTSIPSYLS